MTITDTPRVAVQCLASYNAGRLIFEWVDATDVDEINEAQKRVAARAIEAAKEAGEYPVYFGEPEEFMIADYDNFPGAIVSDLGEYPDYEDVARVASFIESKGEAAAAFYEWASGQGMDIGSLDEDDFDQHYRGEWESEDDFAFEHVKEVGLGGIPATLDVPTGPYETKHTNIIEELSSYLDMDAISRMVFDHGDYSLVNGHVFEANV